MEKFVIYYHNRKSEEDVLADAKKFEDLGYNAVNIVRTEGMYGSTTVEFIRTHHTYSWS
jgi:hypothetical protein